MHQAIVDIITKCQLNIVSDTVSKRSTCIHQSNDEKQTQNNNKNYIYNDEYFLYQQF